MSEIRGNPFPRAGPGGLERAALVASLNCALTNHLRELNLGECNGSDFPSKEQVRQRHYYQRRDMLVRERRTLAKHLPTLVSRFAVGDEVCPEDIDPKIVSVESDTTDALLFRLATTIWSVPVSAGYGRRMRFLVIDRANDKLIGLFALGDPVFNLRVRDDWIGWTVQQRRQNLVNVMDGYVVGAVPPYSALLGGKLVTALLGSSEVSRAFSRKYSKSQGVISGEQKRPRLALVTITSALGRSSIYNRVKLPGLIALQKIGVTQGWGHFHVPDPVFNQMRELLAIDDHKYANGHHFGDGPNWKMRVIRRSLSLIGLDENLLRHGIPREVYAMPLVKEWSKFLQGKVKRTVANRPNANEITKASLDRWILPRSERRPEFKEWSTNDVEKLFAPIAEAA